MPRSKKRKQQVPLSEQDVSSKVARIFQDHGFKVFQNVIVGDTSPDLFMTSPTGSSSVLDIKDWDPSPDNIASASALASRYLVASGADSAFILMPKLQSSDTDSGLVTVADLDEIVDREPFVLPLEEGAPKPRVRVKPDRKVFAAMPFAPSYEDTFVVAIQPACLANDAECVRVDRGAFTGDIVAQIKALIATSTLVIADLSESRPNVLYEMGIAEGLGKPTIQICRTGIAGLPFDVSHNRTIEYETGRTHQLKEQLQDELSGILRRAR